MIGLKLPDYLDKALNQYKQETCFNKTTIIIMALRDFFQNQNEITMMLEKMEREEKK